MSRRLQDSLIAFRNTCEVLVCGKNVYASFLKEAGDLIAILDTLDKNYSILIARAIILPYASPIICAKTTASVRMAQFVMWWVDNKSKDIPAASILESIAERREYERKRLTIEYVVIDVCKS